MYHKDFKSKRILGLCLGLIRRDVAHPEIKTEKGRKMRDRGVKYSWKRADITDKNRLTGEKNVKRPKLKCLPGILRAA